MEVEVEDTVDDGCSYRPALCAVEEMVLLALQFFRLRTSSLTASEIILNVTVSRLSY